jgi:hypothetical protein
VELTQRVLLIVFASAVGEGINEFFFLPWMDGLKNRLNETVRVQTMRIWSGLVGICIAWELNLDVFSLLGATLRHPLVGNVLTGLLLGRGSNWVHELIKRLVLDNELKIAMRD